MSKCHKTWICQSLFCQRWSFAVPLLLYISLFSMTWLLSLPLKSVRHTYKQDEVEKLPNHLEVVRIERDGDINKDFRKEIIVGNADEDSSQIEDPKALLENIFHRADTNNNGLLSKQELTEWINNKIREHINQAQQENFGLFYLIDNNPRNGRISWEEYHSYFLQQKGFSKEYVQKHDKRHKGLNRSMKEAIMRDRASWSEAAHSDPDHLTVDEFLAFRHPESSHATILTLVDELFDKFDRDGDEILTEDEFSSLQTEGDGEKEGDTLTQGEAERRKEFRAAIDCNHDGKADRKELLKMLEVLPIVQLTIYIFLRNYHLHISSSALMDLIRSILLPASSVRRMYIDPKNPRHGKEEAETLLVLSDIDHDGNLSLHEILNKMDLFLGSKMVDTARSFHDEF